MQSIADVIRALCCRGNWWRRGSNILEQRSYLLPKIGVNNNNN
jgi:hypothetical protein